MEKKIIIWYLFPYLTEHLNSYIKLYFNSILFLLVQMVYPFVNVRGTFLQEYVQKSLSCFNGLLISCALLCSTNWKTYLCSKMLLLLMLPRNSTVLKCPCNIHSITTIFKLCPGEAAGWCVFTPISWSFIWLHLARSVQASDNQGWKARITPGSIRHHIDLVTDILLQIGIELIDIPVFLFNQRY